MSKAAKLTKFAKESAADNPQAAAAAEQSQTMAMAIFSKAPLAGFERRNAPPMVKPGDVKVGEAVTGTIIGIVDSPVSTIKGKLLWLKHESGVEFTFPATGVIRNALCPGVKSEDDKALTAALEKEVGKVFAAKRCPDKESARYKKKMFMFDVFTKAA